MSEWIRSNATPKNGICSTTANFRWDIFTHIAPTRRRTRFSRAFFMALDFIHLRAKLLIQRNYKLQITNYKFRRKFTIYQLLIIRKRNFARLFRRTASDFFQAVLFITISATAEVAMVFFFLMGLAVRLTQQNE